MNLFFTSITWFGSLYLLAPASLLLYLFYWQAGSIAESNFLVSSLICTTLLTHILKLLFARQRPASDNLLVTMPRDFSFPSAHTSQITAFALALGLLAAKSYNQPTLSLCWIVLLLLVISVGYSRVYLKVHYLSDVLAGLVVGCVVVLLMAAFWSISFKAH